MNLPGLTDNERRLLLLSVGTHQSTRPLSPIEVATLFRKAITAGASFAQCAEAAHLEGTTWITRFLRLLELPSTVRHLVEWRGGRGSIGILASAEIARLANCDDQESLVQAVLANSMTTAEARQVVQLRIRSKRRLEDCLVEVLGMRPQVEKRHVYIGAITSPQLREKLSGIPQQKRDDLLSRALKLAIPSIDFRVKKLGTERFTLVGSSELGLLIAERRDSIEHDVNDALKREIIDVHR